MDIVHKVIKKFGRNHVIERLIRNVEFRGDCIIIKSTRYSPYMYLSFIYNRKKNHLGAHRISYALSNGRLSKGMFIDHICRNKMCINNIHLRQVTPKINSLENSLSPAYFNSIKTHCKRGHEFNKENTYYLKDNSRQCRECRKIKNKKIHIDRCADKKKREEYNKYQREWRRKSKNV